MREDLRSESYIGKHDDGDWLHNPTTAIFSHMSKILRRLKRNEL